jgi:hypothetical protein
MPTLRRGLDTINKEGHLNIKTPSDPEKEQIRTTITYLEENVPFYDFVEGICAEVGVDPLFRKTIIDSVISLVGEDFDRGKVESAVRKTHEVVLNR